MQPGANRFRAPGKTNPPMPVAGVSRHVIRPGPEVVFEIRACAARVVACNRMQPHATPCNLVQLDWPARKDEPTVEVFAIPSLCRRPISVVTWSAERNDVHWPAHSPEP